MQIPTRRRDPDLPDIVLTDEDRASALLLHPEARVWLRYVVSIGGHPAPPPPGYKTFRGRKMRLEFDDVEVAKHVVGYEGATHEDILRLVDFCKRVKEETGPVLVHCAAGVSRSSAVTLVLLAVLLGPGRDVDAVAHLLDVKEWSAENGLREAPCGIHPNRRVVWLADSILQRGGSLLSALHTGLAHVYRNEWEPS